MNKFLSFLIGVLPFVFFSQENSTQSNSEQLIVVDEVPLFIGCDEDTDNQTKKDCLIKMVNEFIIKNLQYPEEAIRENIQGKVFVVSNINHEGVFEVQKMRSPHSSLEKEAQRIFSLLPKVKPAIKDGKPVNYQFSMPIVFKLSQDITSILFYKDLNNVDDLPVYPGCEDQLSSTDKQLCFDKKLKAFFAQNLKYPKEAIKERVEGIANVNCFINEEGEVIPKDVIDCEELLKSEALRLVNELPKMNPAQKDNKPTSVFVRIKIDFRLPTNIDEYALEPKEVENKSNELAIIEEIPIFPGCEKVDKSELKNCFNSEVFNFIVKKMRYPYEAINKNIQGIVFVNFLVDKKGNIVVNLLEGHTNH